MFHTLWSGARCLEQAQEQTRATSCSQLVFPKIFKTRVL